MCTEVFLLSKLMNSKLTVDVQKEKKTLLLKKNIQFTAK
jgi:hypothetical protein